MVALILKIVLTNKTSEMNEPLESTTSCNNNTFSFGRLIGSRHAWIKLLEVGIGQLSSVDSTNLNLDGVNKLMLLTLEHAYCAFRSSLRFNKG